MGSNGDRSSPEQPHPRARPREGERAVRGVTLAKCAPAIGKSDLERFLAEMSSRA